MNLRNSIKNGLASLLLAGALFSREANAENEKVKTQESKHIYSFADVYDSKIAKTIEHFKREHGVAPESNLVKAMIIEESGSPAFRTGAFVYDPMQIANKGDFALDVLSGNNLKNEDYVREHKQTKLVGDFSQLKGKKHGVIKNGKWNYEGTGMGADDSIFGGVGWLYHKAAIYGSKKETTLSTYEIKKGDTLSHIAKRLNTSVDSLMRINNGIVPTKLQIGQVIQYQNTKTVPTIKGFRDWKAAVRDYNGGGNPNYLEEVMVIKDRLDRSTK